MPPKRPKQEDLAHRVDRLAALLSALEEELLHLQEEGEVAPIGSWITRYQARGQTKRYWYYKWQAIDPVFPTRTGKLSRYKHKRESWQSGLLGGGKSVGTPGQN